MRGVVGGEAVGGIFGVWGVNVAEAEAEFAGEFEHGAIVAGGLGVGAGTCPAGPYPLGMAHVSVCQARLFSDGEDLEGVGEHLAALAAGAATVGGGCCGLGCGGLGCGGGVVGGDEEDVAGGGTEGAGFAGFGLDGLFDDEIGGGVFLDDGEGAVALGGEGFRGCRGRG